MNNKKALVISGGGSLGSFGGGTIQALLEKENKTYNIIVGTSTGSLLSPLVSINEMDRLRTAYTSVTQDSIFKTNPFNKRGGINVLNAIYRIGIKAPISKLFGKNISSLGDSSNLRKTITKFFGPDDYSRLIASDTEVVAAVVNINSYEVEYKSSKDNSYDDFVDWIFISSNAPVFMSLIEKEGKQYVDGGIVEHIPIQHAIDKGATEIDVIVHRPESYEKPNNRISSVFGLFNAVIETMHKEISKDDIVISKLKMLESNGSDIDINIYYTPYKLTDNSLIFDSKIMNEWWDMGYRGIMENSSESNRFRLTKKNNLKQI